MTTENDNERAEELAFKIHESLMLTIRELRLRVANDRQRNEDRWLYMVGDRDYYLKFTKQLQTERDKLEKCRDDLADQVRRLEEPAANWDTFLRTIVERDKREGEPLTLNDSSTGVEAAGRYLTALSAQACLNTRTKERDEARLAAARWEIVAQDFRDKLVEAEVQNNKLAEVDAELLKYKARVEDLKRTVEIKNARLHELSLEQEHHRAEVAILKGECDKALAKEERERARADKWAPIDLFPKNLAFKDGAHVIRFLFKAYATKSDAHVAIQALIAETREPK